jgi:hypothetical protein
MRPGALELLDALVREPLASWNQRLLLGISESDDTLLDVIEVFAHLTRSAHPGALTYFQTLTAIHADVWLRSLEAQPDLSTDDLIERVRLLVMCVGHSQKADHIVELAWTELDRRGLGPEVRAELWWRRHPRCNGWVD